MSFDLTFTYEAEVRTGAGNPVDRRYIETFTIPVSEVPADECVPAMRHIGFVGPLRQEDRTVVDLVHHEGRLYEPLRSLETVRRSEPGIAFEFEAVPVRSSDEQLKLKIRNEFGSQFPLRGADEVKQKGPPRADRVIRSDREKALKVMETIATDVVSIGDVVHIGVSEPVLVAGEGYVRLIRGADAVVHEERPHLFGIGDLPAAVKRAALRAGVGEGVVRVPEYQILDTSWVRHQVTETDTIIGLAEFEGVVAGRVEELPVPAMIAFGRFRNGIGQWRRDYRSANEEAVAFEEVLDRAADLIAELPEGDNEIHAAVAQDIVERARNLSRTPEFDEDLDQFINDSSPVPY